MGNLTNYAEKKLMDHSFKILEFSQPINIYISLHTAEPGEDGSGAEVVGNGYARVQCNVWNAAANRSASNANLLIFPQATGAWGTITHYGVWDAAVGGNCLAYGALNESKIIVSGNEPQIAAGALSLSFNPGAITTLHANQLLDHLLKTAAYIQPANLFVGFSTANPGDNGAALAEPSIGNNYARVQCNAWDAADAVTGTVKNTAAIISPTASGSWGTITHGCIFNAANGDLLWYGTITPPQAVGTDDWLEYPAGTFQISLD